MAVYKKLIGAGGSTGQIYQVGSASFCVPIIIGDTSDSVLIDTGATVSCVQFSLVSALGLFIMSSERGSHIRNLIAADGRMICVRGCVWILFNLQGKTFRHLFYVIDALSTILFWALTF